MTTITVHLILALTIIVGYITLTVLGHDGNNLLALLAGQALGGGASFIATRNGR